MPSNRRKMTPGSVCFQQYGNLVPLFQPVLRIWPKPFTVRNSAMETAASLERQTQTFSVPAAQFTAQMSHFPVHLHHSTSRTDNCRQSSHHLLMHFHRCLNQFQFLLTFRCLNGGKLCCNVRPFHIRYHFFQISVQLQ